MRKKFSERNKMVEPRSAFQIESIDDGLRNRLWNQVQMCYLDTIKGTTNFVVSRDDKIFFSRIYDEFYKSHERFNPYKQKLFAFIKSIFFSFKWYEIYDFLEYITAIHWNSKINKTFKLRINRVLEDEMGGYRFVKGVIVPIIDEIEIKEIEEAVNSEYSGAKIHLANSLESLSDKENPDYINSIKESISAVESIVNLISGKTNVSLNRCIQNLPYDIDSNFKQAMIKMYSWTSSSDGIRHGVTNNEIKSSFAEAKYMLVVCSAFINYLIEKQKNT